MKPNIKYPTAMVLLSDKKIVTTLSWKSRTYYSIFIISVFLAVWFYTGDLISLLFPELEGYARLAVVFGLEILFCIVAVMIIGRKGPLNAIGEMGLLASFSGAFVFSLIATIHLPVFYSFTGSLNTEIEGMKLLFFSFLSPFEEEIVFRGFAFWMLYKYGRLGFWGSVLVPSLLFGFVHLYQANELMDAMGIFGITTAGGIFFSWLLMRWENLWVPIFVHALMNSWWEVFEVDDTALGGYMATIARLLVVGVSIVLTLYKVRLQQIAASYNLYHKEQT